MRASGDYGRLEAMLAESGVGMPYVPPGLQRQFKERAEWLFSTRTFKASPADVMHYVRKAISGALPDFALIARCADGLPGEALHAYVVQSPLQLFLQLRWEARPAVVTAINDLLALASQLAEIVPPAVRRGRLTPDGRLTVVASDFVEGLWEVAASTERAMRPGAGRGRERQAPEQILRGALTWCRS